ncbi:ParA family protein [Corticicoccus populi]|uniref:ParA family protein n=1 Tax=Corticicoccus populi TaxID=1812821 RepID=A0ABW5WUR5_9STAP
MRRTQAESSRQEIDDKILKKLYDSAIVVKNGIEERGYKSVLFSSLSEREATAEAAVHIGYLLTQLKKKVLIVNLNHKSSDLVDGYLKADKGASLIKQLKESAYISEAIAQSQYSNLDLIEIEEVTSDEFVSAVNEYDLKSKLSPLTNYYDVLIVIGPGEEHFSYYANILELVDSAVTIVNSRKNDRKRLKTYMDKFKVFNIRSFGIIRKD